LIKKNTRFAHVNMRFIYILDFNEKLTQELLNHLRKGLLSQQTFIYLGRSLSDIKWFTLLHLPQGRHCFGLIL